MKTILKYDKEQNLIHETLHGDCSIRNLAEVFDEMEAFDVNPGLKILADIRDANLDETSYTSVLFLEKRLDEFLDRYLPVRKAIIVESVLEFGIARMYEILAEKDGLEVQIFKDRSEALQWLK